MPQLASMLLTIAALGTVVLGFRMLLRRPRGVSGDDPPGVRTVAIFAGDAPEFFRDDRPEKLLVGVRLFEMLCDGLARGASASKSGAACRMPRGPTASSARTDSRWSWSGSKINPRAAGSLASIISRQAVPSGATWR